MWTFWKYEVNNIFNKLSWRLNLWKGRVHLNNTYMWVYNVFRVCPMPVFHPFLSFHWFSRKSLALLDFINPSLHPYFGLPLFRLSDGVHSITISVVSSRPCILHARTRLSQDIFILFLTASISTASTFLLFFSVSLHVSTPYNKLLLRLIFLLFPYSIIFNLGKPSFSWPGVNRVPTSLFPVPVSSKLTSRHLYVFFIWLDFSLIVQCDVIRICTKA